MKSYAQIVGWGRYVPSRVMTNHDLARMVDTSDEWIRSRTGITERHIAGPRESTSTMGVRAALAALEVADLNPSKLDLVILATITPDYGVSATASLLQDGIGATRAGAFDLNAGCSGFVYALAVASRLIESGAHRNVLVVGSDAVSRIIDWTDRSTCVLFGDGAGAVVLQASENATGLLSCTLGSDGSGAESLYVPAGGARLPASLETLQNRQHYIKMNGNEVFRFAVHAMTRATMQVVIDAGLQPSEVDLFIPHQANVRIIQAAAKALRLPDEKVFINVDRYGNTSAASIPIALCEAIEQGRVKPGDRLALVGFGAGLSWAAVVLQWGVPAVGPERPWWRYVLQSLWEREAVARSFARRTRRRIEGLRRSNVHENGHAQGLRS